MGVSAIREPPMPKFKRSSALQSPAQRITATIIEKLEQGAKPWVRPWCGLPIARPLHSCGTPYRGMKTFWLWMMADAAAYVSPYWMMGWTTLAHRPSVAA
jgi:antirestriction protein ArdC